MSSNCPTSFAVTHRESSSAIASADLHLAPDNSGGGDDFHASAARGEDRCPSSSNAVDSLTLGLALAPMCDAAAVSSLCLEAPPPPRPTGGSGGSVGSCDLSGADPFPSSSDRGSYGLSVCMRASASSALLSASCMAALADGCSVAAAGAGRCIANNGGDDAMRSSVDVEDQLEGVGEDSGKGTTGKAATVAPAAAGGIDMSAFNSAVRRFRTPLSLSLQLYQSRPMVAPQLSIDASNAAAPEEEKAPPRSSDEVTPESLSLANGDAVIANPFAGAAPCEAIGSPSRGPRDQRQQREEDGSSTPLHGALTSHSVRGSTSEWVPPSPVPARLHISPSLGPLPLPVRRRSFSSGARVFSSLHHATADANRQEREGELAGVRVEGEEGIATDRSVPTGPLFLSTGRQPAEGGRAPSQCLTPLERGLGMEMGMGGSTNTSTIHTNTSFVVTANAIATDAPLPYGGHCTPLRRRGLSMSLSRSFGANGVGMAGDGSSPSRWGRQPSADAERANDCGDDAKGGLSIVGAGGALTPLRRASFVAPSTPLARSFSRGAIGIGHAASPMGVVGSAAAATTAQLLQASTPRTAAAVAASSCNGTPNLSSARTPTRSPFVHRRPSMASIAAGGGGGSSFSNAGAAFLLPLPTAAAHRIASSSGSATLRYANANAAALRGSELPPLPSRQNSATHRTMGPTQCTNASFSSVASAAAGQWAATAADGVVFSTPQRMRSQETAFSINGSAQRGVGAGGGGVPPSPSNSSYCLPSPAAVNDGLMVPMAMATPMRGNSALNLSSEGNAAGAMDLDGICDRSFASTTGSAAGSPYRSGTFLRPIYPPLLSASSASVGALAGAMSTPQMRAQQQQRAVSGGGGWLRSSPIPHEWVRGGVGNASASALNGVLRSQMGVGVPTTATTAGATHAPFVSIAAAGGGGAEEGADEKKKENESTPRALSEVTDAVVAMDAIFPSSLPKYGEEASELYQQHSDAIHAVHTQQTQSPHQSAPTAMTRDYSPSANASPTDHYYPSPNGGGGRPTEAFAGSPSVPREAVVSGAEGAIVTGGIGADPMAALFGEGSASSVRSGSNSAMSNSNSNLLLIASLSSDTQRSSLANTTYSYAAAASAPPAVRPLLVCQEEARRRHCGDEEALLDHDGANENTNSNTCPLPMPRRTVSVSVGVAMDAPPPLPLPLPLRRDAATSTSPLHAEASPPPSSVDRRDAISAPAEGRSSPSFASVASTMNAFGDGHIDSHASPPRLCATTDATALPFDLLSPQSPPLREGHTNSDGAVDEGEGSGASPDPTRMLNGDAVAVTFTSTAVAGGRPCMQRREDFNADAAATAHVARRLSGASPAAHSDDGGWVNVSDDGALTPPLAARHSALSPSAVSAVTLALTPVHRPIDMDGDGDDDGGEVAVGGSVRRWVPANSVLSAPSSAYFREVSSLQRARRSSLDDGGGSQQREAEGSGDVRKSLVSRFGGRGKDTAGKAAKVKQHPAVGQRQITTQTEEVWDGGPRGGAARRQQGCPCAIM